MSFIYRLICKLCHITISSFSNLLPKKGTIFMLHNISNVGEYSISEDLLEEFLIKIRGLNVIKLINWEQERKFIAITIDDVPESFYLKGFPLFKKYNIPFTIFVSTELLDKPGYISSEQLKLLSQNKLCTVGSHGTFHEFYRNLNKSEKDSFLKKSKYDLFNICGAQIDLFAFPYGSYYACGYRNKNLVMEYYKYGFGTVSSFITCPSLLGKYFLPRINLTSKIICTKKRLVL